ncbi:hypothetical protein [Mesorhizobium sp. M8A.F.Ca.ET.165.01.1.1]|uniref:hypothetical protein n=1 Tax=Mesorhizobium sp. M8A.F.Ca.ET.165.01.1.1 TaxID=2563960 RepID=UPI00109385C2|nr:hypothetical protein [Mesorhizobium sp. M8A.F.Ca.ET.165.01.1.1]TGT42789.1 hypothetical protein EN808_12975 [Mesorhizobium sp. M8A.F.Ca.ET.165.01.1.1]
MPIPSAFSAADNERIRDWLDQGIKQTEIAAAMGRPYSTVKSHIQKGYHITGAKLEAAPRIEESDDYGRIIKPKLPETILVIPDIQAPFHIQQALPFLSMVAQAYQVDEVVGIGDEIDMGWLSRYDKYPEIDEPSRELEKAQEFMAQLFRLFPKATALTSNHVHGRMQGARKVARILPEMMVQWEQLIAAPNTWRWCEEYHLGHVLFRHGDKWPKLTNSHLVKAIPDNYGKHMCVVHGHIHSEHGVVAQARVGDDDVWAAYTGCLMNPRSKAADYVKAPKLKLGCIVIHRGVVHRIPFRRDPVTMQWTGKLERD